MKYFFLSSLFIIVAVVSFAGFRGGKSELPPIQVFPDMDKQAKVKAQVSSDFFSNGVSMRLPIAGTNPIGYQMPSKPASEGLEPQLVEFSRSTGYYYTGKMGDFYGDGFPPEIKVTPMLLKRGQERFNISCAICHGAAGNGKGVFTKYSVVLPTDLTGPGFDDAANPAYRPDGKIYDTITNGWNQMGGYGANITVSDRWAIVAYIRAIQYAAKNPAK